MEIVRVDGGAFELKEGERHELGRGSAGFDDAQSLDKSVSRVHVIAELLRPASRKGKEVVGKSTALKLHVHVVGRNPICITPSQGGGEERNSSRVKFAGKGETHWLAPGDKFALSIRKPLLFLLRQCSPGSTVGDEMPIESQKAGRTPKPAENNLISPAEKNVKEMESKSLDEEEGIARAVARRQRRKLERETEQERMRLSEQRHSQNGGGLEEDSDRVMPDAESHEKEESVLPRQTNYDSCPVDPVSEFGFVVKGSEFQAYEKRSKTENGLAWNWKIDKKGESGDDSFEGNALDGNGKMNNKNSVNSRLEEEDEEDEEDDEWGGDNKEEEEQVSKATGPKAKSKVSTRSSKSHSSDEKRKILQTLNTQLPNRSGTISKDGEDLSGFIVEDNDSIEEDGEDGDEDDWMDADEIVPHQIENRNGGKQQPACKYGSNCYRKNKEHLAQFSHPPR